MRGYDQLTQKVSPPVFQTISDTWSIDTWSIGTVRSFKAVPPGQRTDVPGQPGGLPDGSRRSQRSADLRSTPPTRPHPNGVPDRTDTTTTHVHTIAFWHPSGMPPVSSPNTGGLHFIPTSGYPLPTLRVAGGNTRHLKFTDTTGSFDTVCALKGVSFDLRKGVTGQPGGLTDGSRRSQRSVDLRFNAPTRRHPGGVPDRTKPATANLQIEPVWHPSGMHSVSLPYSGSLHFIPTSGYPLPTLRVAGGNTRHLKFTDTTGSFDTVCALKGVSFDLRTTAPGQPGGLPEGSRRSKRSADLRSTPPPRRHPNGVPDRSLSAANAYVLVVFWHPSGMRPVSPSHTGGLHSIPTSGYRLATLRLARRARDTSVAKRFR
jgi:hypothetical protein